MQGLRRWACWLALVALLAPSDALAELPAKAFFQPFLTHVALSPDGQSIAALVARAEKQTLIVRGAKGETAIVPVARIEEPGWRVADLLWANDQRLIFELRVFGGGTQRSRLWAVDRDGSHKAGLGDFVAQPDAGIVSVLRDRPDRVLLAHDGKAFELDILHGHTGSPLADQAAVRRWFADAAGRPRAGESAASAVRRRLLYARSGDQADLSLVSEFDPHTQPGFSFGAFADSDTSLYVISWDPASRKTLRRFDLSSATLGETVFAHPEVDVGEVVLDAAGRAIGVDYIVDFEQRHYWDEAAAAEQRGLDAALGTPTNRIVGASWDGNTKLVRASGPSDPPHYYLLERKEQALSPLFSVYPELDGVPLAEVRAFSFDARDGLPLHAYVTRPRDAGAGPWPTVVLVHDHSAAEPGRDWLRFDPLVQFLANRGFAVLQVNYRGSGGYGAAFEAAGRDAWGIGIQRDLEDGVLQLVAQGVADPKRVGIFGHGFGGYSALMGAVRNPDFYAAAAAYGAPSDLSTLARDHRNDWGELPAEGDEVTGAWADRRRVSAASPYDHVESVDVPILLGHGARDTRVDIKHAVRLQREFQVAEKESLLVRFEEEHAEISRDDNRIFFYEELARFFREHLSPPRLPPPTPPEAGGE